MNVLNIKKQCDKPLIYTRHAFERAEEREVPLPKYIPMNAVCSSKRFEDYNTVYTLEYNYLGDIHYLVVSDEMLVMTVYPKGSNDKLKDRLQRMILKQEAIKSQQRNLRVNKSDEYYMLKTGKYRHREFDIEAEQYCYL
jgi:hypothetical protein